MPGPSSVPRGRGVLSGDPDPPPGGFPCGSRRLVSSADGDHPLGNPLVLGDIGGNLDLVLPVTYRCSFYSKLVRRDQLGPRDSPRPRSRVNRHSVSRPLAPPAGEDAPLAGARIPAKADFFALVVDPACPIAHHETDAGSGVGCVPRGRNSRSTQHARAQHRSSSSVASYPRSMNGLFVAITVRNCTLASRGSPAM
jgi:hypothetical protein